MNQTKLIVHLNLIINHSTRRQSSTCTAAPLTQHLLSKPRHNSNADNEFLNTLIDIFRY